MWQYISPKDPSAELLLRATFPEAIRLKKIALCVSGGGMSLTSYWSGGSRDYHRVVDLSTMQTVDVPENGSGFTAIDREFGPSGIPVSLPAPGYAVVTLTRVGGRKIARISVHPDNATKLLAGVTQ